MKDNFSAQSTAYVKFRPNYPQGLVDYFLSLTDMHDSCWDCGTGNGQLAEKLAQSFHKVYATDISEKQLLNAKSQPNIEYSLQPAEETTFPDHYFDLITVAQAAHWFDHERFNREVKRVLKPYGVIALIGYGLVQVDESSIQEEIDHFYWQVTHPYWDQERHHIEEEYHNIPFPFEEISSLPKFDMNRKLVLDELVGYISTWSAVQHYIKSNGHSPIDQLKKKLEKIWKSDTHEINFPLFMRIGRIN